MLLPSILNRIYRILITRDQVYLKVIIVHLVFEYFKSLILISNIKKMIYQSLHHPKNKHPSHLLL